MILHKERLFFKTKQTISMNLLINTKAREEAYSKVKRTSSIILSITGLLLIILVMFFLITNNITLYLFLSMSLLTLSGMTFCICMELIEKERKSKLK